jgi:hypothetical protein
MDGKETVTAYFMQVTHEKFGDVTKRLDKIDSKLEKLISFRLMLIGGAAAVSAIISAAMIYLGK